MSKLDSDKSQSIKSTGTAEYLKHSSSCLRCGFFNLSELLGKWKLSRVLKDHLGRVSRVLQDHIGRFSVVLNLTFDHHNSKYISPMFFPALLDVIGRGGWLGF